MFTGIIEEVGVIRAIRRSEGKWTPRKVDGVPQRTAYTFRGNFINESH